MIGIELVDLLAEGLGGADGLARVHPAHVAAHGVDFAVVGDVAVGMGQLPTGKGVGGEALVDQAKGAGGERVGQLDVELLNLRGQHQALVDDGAAGERGDVEGLLVLDLGGGNLVFGAAADAIEQALEGFFVEAGGLAGRPTKSCSM
jgi:hypothetical protein